MCDQELILYENNNVCKVFFIKTILIIEGAFKYYDTEKYNVHRHFYQYILLYYYKYKGSHHDVGAGVPI